MPILDLTMGTLRFTHTAMLLTLVKSAWYECVSGNQDEFLDDLGKMSQSMKVIQEIVCSMIPPAITTSSKYSTTDCPGVTDI